MVGALISREGGLRLFCVRALLLFPGHNVVSSTAVPIVCVSLWGSERAEPGSGAQAGWQPALCTSGGPGGAARPLPRGVCRGPSCSPYGRSRGPAAPAELCTADGPRGRPTATGLGACFALPLRWGGAVLARCPYLPRAAGRPAGGAVREAERPAGRPGPRRAAELLLVLLSSRRSFGGSRRNAALAAPRRLWEELGPRGPALLQQYEAPVLQ